MKCRMNRNPTLRPDTMQLLQQLLLDNNGYASIYQHAFEILEQFDAPDYSIRLCATPNKYSGYNNLPTVDEVAVIIPGTSNQGDNRDIILSRRPTLRNSDDGKKHYQNLQRISDGHPAYAPLHYVLLFPYGEPGWHWDLKLTTGKRLTLRQYAAFRLHDRQNQFSTILHGGQLLHHYIVDMFAGIDQNRLHWLTNNQSQLRLSHVQGMEDALNGQQDDHITLSNIGQRIFLPSSYSGGPRDMHQRFQDSMAIARHFKKIDIFLTITANPNWPEIKRELLPTQQPHDRPDLIARVFKMKSDALMHLITQKGIFGHCVAHVKTTQFQKHGFPHDHILIILEESYKLSTPTAIDEVIWARWPDPITQPHLFEIVKKYMLHGPCGELNKRSPCMRNGKCRFGFPKAFQDRTTLSEDGYPSYYRPNDGRSYVVNGFSYDNRWIAPYNPFCCEFMDGHANCECTFSFWTTKYINRYLKRTTETAKLAVEDQNNEIKQYIQGRYFSHEESAWRIYAFAMHGQSPSVAHLPIHLPGQQSITFHPKEDPQQVLYRASQADSALTAFFAANQVQGAIGDMARQYTYQEFPEHFTFKSDVSPKRWQP